MMNGSLIESDHSSAEAHGTVAIPEGSPIENDNSSGYWAKSAATVVPRYLVKAAAITMV